MSAPDRLSKLDSIYRARRQPTLELELEHFYSWLSLLLHIVYPEVICRLFLPYAFCNSYHDYSVREAALSQCPSSFSTPSHAQALFFGTQAVQPPSKA